MCFARGLGQLVRGPLQLVPAVCARVRGQRRLARLGLLGSSRSVGPLGADAWSYPLGSRQTRLLGRASV
jgi:hypothetical protein